MPGEESAHAARTRFGNAVNAVLTAHSQDSIAVAAQGTVSSLLVAQASGPDLKSLGPLDALTLDVPGLLLRERLF